MNESSTLHIVKARATLQQSKQIEAELVDLRLWHPLDLHLPRREVAPLNRVRHQEMTMRTRTLRMNNPLRRQPKGQEVPSLPAPPKPLQQTLQIQPQRHPPQYAAPNVPPAPHPAKPPWHACATARPRGGNKPPEAAGSLPPAHSKQLAPPVWQTLHPHHSARAPPHTHKGRGSHPPYPAGASENASPVPALPAPAPASSRPRRIANAHAPSVPDDPARHMRAPEHPPAPPTTSEAAYRCSLASRQTEYPVAAPATSPAAVDSSSPPSPPTATYAAPSAPRIQMPPAHPPSTESQPA